jgi:putative transposase
MGRNARLVVPLCAHHATQRGNQGQDVFFGDSDRHLYLDLLRENCRRHGIRVLAWCLMTNHVHLVVVPDREQSLAKGLGRTHSDYARWVHLRQRQIGHLWQNRFHSCVLDEAHQWEALRYVELNPVRAGLVGQAWEWPWSSARAHLAGVDRSGLLDLTPWQERYDGPQWRSVLEEGYRQAALIERLREATLTGRPFGNQDFVRQLEVQLNRRLRPEKRGPKARAAAAALDEQKSFGIS